MNQLVRLAIMGLLLATMTHAATLFGQVYDGETLQPLSKVVVQINTIPEQTQVTDENGYSFTIPNSGIFTISAAVANEPEGTLHAEQNVTVIENGAYQVDIILFSDLNENQGLQDLLEESNSSDDVSSLADLGSDQVGSIQGWLPLIIIILLAVIGIGAAWWHFSNRKSSALVTPAEKTISIPNEKKEQAMGFIRKRGGRVLQIDLRKELDMGEAYASLLVAELESEGRLKKIKHGRGNILVLKE